MCAILWCLAVLMMPFPASALDFPTLAPVYVAGFHASTGSWARYDFVEQSGASVSSRLRIKFAVVSREGDDVWIEQSYLRLVPKPEPGQERISIKGLVSADYSKTKKLLMKSEAGIVDVTSFMEVIDLSIAMSTGAKTFTEAGAAEVKVPAGKFTVKKLVSSNATDSEQETVYFKDGVGPYGVVKQISTGGSKVGTLTLLSYGTNALPEMTGEPIVMPESFPGMPDIRGMIKKALQDAQKKEGSNSSP